MERLAADPDTPAQVFSERSVAAQTLLIAASGNGRLPALYEHLSEISSWRMIRGRATSFLKAERRREAAKDWRAIERAIGSGDASAAEAGARLLFAHSSAAVRAELQGVE
jgi:DNA-binding FadR family transcriptional regulator